MHVSLPLHLQDFNPHPAPPSHFDLLRSGVDEHKMAESYAVGKMLRAKVAFVAQGLCVEMAKSIMHPRWRSGSAAGIFPDMLSSRLAQLG